MIASVDTRPIAAPKRQRRATTMVPPAITVAHSDEKFELTAQEMSMAMRYFGVLRRMEQSMATETYGSFLRAVESLAQKYPRQSAPRLRLVNGSDTWS